MATASREPIAINGRTYAWPPRPLVVVCVDGCEPDYIEQAFRAGAMPFLASAAAGRALYEHVIGSRERMHRATGIAAESVVKTAARKAR